MIVDFDPSDNWADLLSPENPIKEAHDCGDGVTFDVYSRQTPGVGRGHPDYVMSGSDLAEFDRCPHRWLVGFRDDETRSTEWGQLIDCLMMAPEEFDERFAIVPATYKNDKGEEKEWNFNATACKEWRAANSGKQEVKQKLLDEAKLAVSIMLLDKQVAEVFAASRKQVMLTGFYDDIETSLRIPLRCLIDLVPPADFLADLKTATNAHPAAWRKHVHQFGYHLQAARHLDLWNAAHSDNRREFRHYVQENFHPYQPGKRILSTEFLALGRDRYVRALKRYAKCLKQKRWPGYDEGDSNMDIVIDGHLVTSPEAWMVA